LSAIPGRIYSTRQVLAKGSLSPATNSGLLIVAFREKRTSAVAGLGIVVADYILITAGTLLALSPSKIDENYQQLPTA